MRWKWFKFKRRKRENKFFGRTRLGLVWFSIKVMSAHYNSVMGNPPQETQRPTMRRKSSAQNLLSSFKSKDSALPPISTTGTVSSATGLSFATTGTPVSTTPMGREWDAQSLHSDSVAPSVMGTSPALGQGTSVEYMRDLVQKRIITLTYMRNIHEGYVDRILNSGLFNRLTPSNRRSHWFHTIMMSRTELDRVFNNTAMKKR